MGNSRSKEKEAPSLLSTSRRGTSYKLKKMRNNNQNNNNNNNNANNGHHHNNPNALGNAANNKKDAPLRRSSHSFHEALVREHDRKHDFDDIYEILNEIGQGGLCKIYRIQKYDDKIGGSSRPEGVRKSRLRRNISHHHHHGHHGQHGIMALGQEQKKQESSSPHSPGRHLRRTTYRHQSTPNLRSMDRKTTATADEPPPPPYLDGSFPTTPTTTNNSKKKVQPTPSLLGRATSASNPHLYFALKVINLALVKEDKIDQLKNEVEILKTLDHKNIIKAYETFQMRKHKKLMIIMELCTGGDLYARMPYTEQQVAIAMRQVLSAIAYMHTKHIIHRDIKLENLMWESKHPEAVVKVIDFGLSKKYSPNSGVLTERVGTLYSMSPETMKGIYTTQADSWSIGVCTYIMLSMTKPFEGQTPKQLVANVLQCNYSFEPLPPAPPKTPPPTTTPTQSAADVVVVEKKTEDPNDDEHHNNFHDDTQVNMEEEERKRRQVWATISKEAKSFISQLLVLEPLDRLTADKAKTHEWFDKILRRRTSVGGTSRSLLSHHQRESSSGGSSSDTSYSKQYAPVETLETSLHGGGDKKDDDEDGEGDDDGESLLPPLTTEEFKNRVRQNIIQYADMGEFRRLALNVIAKKSTSNEIFELRKVFDEFDTHNSGTITLEEFKAALAQFEYSEDDIMEIFRKVDVNKNNVINYTEFLAAALETQGTIEEYRLAEAFDVLDRDDSGYISRDNLKQLLGDRAKHDDGYLDRLISEADFKKDGRISYEEFLQVFAREQRAKSVQTLYQARTAGSSVLEDAADRVLQQHGLSSSYSGDPLLPPPPPPPAAPLQHKQSSSSRHAMPPPSPVGLRSASPKLIERKATAMAVSHQTIEGVLVQPISREPSPIIHSVADHHQNSSSHGSGGGSHHSNHGGSHHSRSNSSSHGNNNNNNAAATSYAFRPIQREPSDQTGTRSMDPELQRIAALGSGDTDDEPVGLYVEDDGDDDDDGRVPNIGFSLCPPDAAAATTTTTRK